MGYTIKHYYKVDTGMKLAIRKISEPLDPRVGKRFQKLSKIQVYQDNEKLFFRNIFEIMKKTCIISNDK